jgi:hypothetical protein
MSLDDPLLPSVVQLHCEILFDHLVGVACMAQLPSLRTNAAIASGN